MGSVHSFDVWDTLLRRRCHPDEVKLFTARCAHLRLHGYLRDPSDTPWRLMEKRVEVEREIGRETRESWGLDDEYDLVSVIRRWLTESFALPASAGVDDEAEHLAELEVEQEIRVTYLDSEGDRRARGVNGARLVAVSDFYMGESRLRRILGTHAPHLPFERVFVSCDARLNKRSSRLFEHVHRELGVTPRDHVHMGDNPEADVHPARGLGIEAVHFRNPGEDKARAAHNVRFGRRTMSFEGTVELLERALESAAPPPSVFGPRQKALYRAGARMSPVFVGLALMAEEEAIRRGVDRVFYCTREGEFFGRVHTAIAGVRPTGLAGPEAVLLEVSRIATFFPSLQEFSTDELMRLWRLYSRQSLGQLLTSLGVRGLSAEPFLRKYGIDPGRVIHWPWKDGRVQGLLNDRHFRRMLERWQKTRREDLYAHFAGRGFTRELDRAVMVDIGWRGTIQDNIAHLFPGTQIHGVYLGLLGMLNEQPRNTSKAAIGPDLRHDDARTGETIRFVAPFEMVCNSAGGSVRGYERQPDGSTRVLTVEDPGESRVHAAYTRYFQEGAVAAAPVVAEWVRRHAVSAAEMRPLCLRLMREFAFEPPRVLARSFFSLTHNETFGVGGFVEKKSPLPRHLASAARRSEVGWMRLVEHCEESTWPQGLLTLHGREKELKRYSRWRLKSAGIVQERRPASSVEAKLELEALESSLAWRLLRAMKQLPPYAIYARRRWGENWADRPEGETPDERLAQIRRGRAYRIIEEVKSSAPYALYARTVRGRR